MRLRHHFAVESLETRRLLNGSAIPLPIDSFQGNESSSDTDTSHSGGCGCPLCKGLIAPVGAAEAESILSASSPQVLFIDFDGATVTTDPVGFGYQTPYQVSPFDLSALGFAGQEETAKNYILQFVQEDYAAYNVTVTTTQPTSGQYSTIYMDDFSFEGSGVLGVAAYDVGNHSRNDFGFVFVREFGVYASGNSLLTFSQYLANTVSHEAGHVFGLNHVSGSTNLMQPVLNFNPVKLSFGSGVNEDSQVLLGANLGYRSGIADDVGNVTATAAALELGQSLDGILERRDDIDAFTIVVNANGPITLDIDTTPFTNLNSVLTVKDANGTTLAFNDDSSGGPDSGLVFDGIAGQTYTIFVSSAGGVSSGTYTLHAITANGGSPAISLTEEVGTADDLVLSFDTQVVGSTSFHTFTIDNTGQSTLVIDGLRILGDSTFSLDESSQPGNASDDIAIEAGQSHTFTVQYTPTAAGSDTATVQIISNDSAHPTLTLDLNGSAEDPVPSVVEVDSQHRLSYQHYGLSFTISLKGAGVAQVIFDDTGTSIQELNLTGTDATTSIKIKGAVTLNHVQGDGDLKSFTAPMADLVGGQFDLAGQIGRLTLQNVAQSDLLATSIQRLNVNSLDHAHVRADNGLLSANVAGDMIDSSIETIGGTGTTAGIGAVKVLGNYSGSFISAGVETDSIAAILASEATPTTGGTIGSVKLGSVDTSNAGVEFGIFSNGPITNVRIGTDRVSLPYVSDDFVVAMLS